MDDEWLVSIPGSCRRGGALIVKVAPNAQTRYVSHSCCIYVTTTSLGFRTSLDILRPDKHHPRVTSDGVHDIKQLAV